MPSRKIVFAASAIAIIGAGAAAIAATGDRHSRFSEDGTHANRHHAEQGERGEGRRRGGRRADRSTTLEDVESRARERFASFDKNGDNTIDASEIEARFAARMGDRREHRGPGNGRMFQRLDADRDGKVTRAEIDAVLKQRFADLDLNNDGRITDADLPPMMRGRGILSGDQTTGHAPFFGRGMRAGQRERGMGMAGMELRGSDTNKDGAVTFEEFAARRLGRFAHMDRNKDGIVDQADTDAVRKEMLAYRVARFIHRFGPDADKAGKVTREQFLAAAKQRFDRRDVNKDGTIDRQDRGFGHQGPGRRHMQEREQR